MNGNSRPGPNPYVGPRPFTAAHADRFFGRRVEISVLRDLVLSRQAVLLFAESGAGKSSLLQAGLVPELTRPRTIGSGARRREYQRMAVLPIAGVGSQLAGDQAVGQQALADANPFVLSVLASLNPDAGPADLAGLTLAEGLAPHLPPEEEESGRPAMPALLIVDQFEELFTRHQGAARSGARDHREDFFLQVRQALQDHPYLHLLFSIREDYIARLDPYAHLLPDSLRSQFRLERLRAEAALEAVVNPAELAGRSYDAGVAETLVDDLRRVQVGRLAREQAEAAGLEAPLGDFVEPVHLQIVCQQLWDQVLPNESVINAGHLAQLGEVDRALINFYEDALSRAVQASGVSGRMLRRWFEEELITPARTRGLVYQDQEQNNTAGLPNAAIEVLRDAYIIRSLIRGGELWFELAHDRLVEPIIESNREWRANYFSPVAAGYQTWRAGGQDDRLLLSGAQLAEAAAFAARNPGDLLPEERDYLADSQQAEAERLAALRRRRRLRVVLVAAAILVLALVIAGLLAYQELRRASSRELALASISSLETDPERGILLADQALDTFFTSQAEEALRRALEESRVRRRLVLLESDIDPFVAIQVTAVPPEEAPSGEVPRSSAGLAAQPDPSTISSRPFWDVAYNHDGTRLAVAVSEGLVAIWDLPGESDGDLTASARIDRPLLLRAESPAGDEESLPRLMDVAFSPDDQLLAAAGDDGRARIWDAVTGDLLHTLESSPVRMWALAFSPDGRTLYTAGEDDVVRSWDVATGQDTGAPFLPHRADIFDLALSPDGQVLATAGRDGQVKLFALDTGELAVSLPDHEDPVWAVAFSPDGRLMASGGQDKKVILWNVTLPDPVAQLPIEAQISAQPRVVLPDPTDSIAAVAFSPESRCLAAAGLDRSARLWDVQTGRVFAELDGHTDQITGLAFNPGQDRPDPVPPAERCGRQLATASRSGEVRLWNAGANSSGPLLVEHVEPVEAAVFSHDGHRIATASDDEQVIIWDAATLEPLLRLEGHQDIIDKVAYSPDDRYLATASRDGTARLWDVATGRELAILTGHADADPDLRIGVFGLAFDPTGALLATSGDDGAVRLWRVPSGEPGPVISLGPGVSVYGVQFDPQGRWLATTSSDGFVRLLDAATITDLAGAPTISVAGQGEPLIWRAFHGGNIYDAAFSPDGRRLASISWDNSIKIWDTGDGEEIATLEGHADRPIGVHFSPDGRTLATSAADGTVRVWDVQSGDILQTIPGPEFNGLDYSPEGDRLVVAGEDGTARLYDLELEQLLALARERLTRALTGAECRRFLGRDECPD